MSNIDYYFCRLWNGCELKRPHGSSSLHPAVASSPASLVAVVDV